MVKLFGDGIKDDTQNIQELLDNGGYIHIPDGKYLITKPLIIHDNTHLHASQNAHFRLADGANCSLLDNDGLYRKCYNYNITIEGGIWDGNNMAQVRKVIPDENVPCVYDEYIENKLTIFMTRFVHTKNLVIKNLTYKDPTSFAVHIADAECFRVENIVLDFNLQKPNMDGIHIQGPARFGKIIGIFGDANDDHVALCANGTTRSEITRGPIEDVEISGIYCNNGYTGVRLLSCGDPVRNISISEMHGKFRLYAVSFTHHYPIREDRPILIENVHLSNIFVSKGNAFSSGAFDQNVKYSPLVWVESGVKARNVLVENLYRNETNQETVAATVHISKDAVLDNFKIKNIFENRCNRDYPTLVNETECHVEQLD